MSFKKTHGNTIRVMVVGPGPRTEGGITEVISRIVTLLQQMPGYVVTWVPLHRSGSAFQKVIAAIKGIATAIFMMPRYHIVHIHSAAYVSFVRKSLVFWVARLWRRRIIWHLHTPNKDFCDFFGSQGFIGKYGRYVLGKADKVVVLSESWRPLATRYVDDSKIAVILNPTPNIDSSTSAEKSDDLVRVLYLAHLIQRKGYPDLIRAFAGVYRANPRCRLVFAGSGETREALELCKELGIENGVEFLGWIGEPRRSDELRKAEVFVLPSYQEGLPMGVLEAMAFGLAVITTPVGGIGDVVRDQENGVLIKPGNVAELETALLDLVQDGEKRTRLGKQAEEDVRSFAPVNISSKWIELYEELVDQQPKGEVT